MDRSYKGLNNFGALCYMNSLIQTLFMTPEFRNLIYTWEYNDKIHPKPSDSILYQLQRLFGKLQSQFPGQTSTRDLTKSFQWDQQDHQIQQDIQQFNRVLFQALEKSLRKQTTTLNNQFKELYEGSLVHYTHCNKCGYQSNREQLFQDLILTIKNVYEKVYNKNIELAFQRYLKPQRLDHDNMYACPQCNQKVPAQRGVKFLRMPKLLNIILQRFMYDYFIQERQKMNDYVEFPFVLNFNSYMHGYDNIPQKQDQNSAYYFKEAPVVRKTVVNTDTKKDVKKVVPVKKGSVQPNIAGKLVTKPKAQTKSFLKEMRKKKNVYNTGDNDDVIYINGTASMPTTQAPQHMKKVQSAVEQQHKVQDIPKKPKSQEIDVHNCSPPKQEHSQQKQKRQKQQTIQTGQTSTQKKQQKNSIPVPPSLDLLPPSLSDPYKKVQGEVNIEEELARKIKQKKRFDTEKEVKRLQMQQKNKELIQKYLKDGPLVYELYSVMIHSGTATHGHYYSYIKSFQDDKWYMFNDQRVSQINVEEVSKGFGGSGHANAYALYYRLVQSLEDRGIKHFERVAIPPYINSTINAQIQNLKKKQKEKISNIENVIVLKIHYQLYVKQLQILKTSSLKLCLEKSKEMFNIGDTIKPQNIRLRMFNPSSEMKLQTFTGKQDMSLQQLKINSYKSLLLQTKKQEEVFDEFEAGYMTIRITLWQQCPTIIQSLQQNFLTLHKVSVNRFSTIKDIEGKIKQKIKQILGQKYKQGPLCIVKRHLNQQYSYHQIISAEQYKSKSLDEVQVLENQILYIEPDGQNLNWPRQFENQIYRISVKYNIPGETQQYNQLTDSRLTLMQLKEVICNNIGLNSDQVIFRRGNRTGMELKTTDLTLKENRFINGTQLFLEKGIAAKQGQARIHLYLAFDAPRQIWNRLHQFQFISDIPINTNLKANEAKQILAKYVKKLKGLQLQADKFRIRQRMNEKLGKIYRDRTLKQQQVIQKRQIAIEMNKNDNLDPKQYAVYVRYWDQQTWQLSEKKQFIVNKNTSMIDFGTMIATSLKDIAIDNMRICRILSIHKFSMLDLVELEYFPLNESSVFTEPLFVNSDGLLFIVKQTDQQLRQLTKQQQMKFGGTLKVIKRGPARNNYKKQKGVTITVIEKQSSVQAKTQNKVQESIETNKIEPTSIEKIENNQ